MLLEMENLEQASEVSDLINREYRVAVFQAAAAHVQPSVEESTWQAFWLTYVEGVSIQGAAEKLGTRVGHIYFARSRVLAKIRKFVSHYEESDA